MKYLKFAEELGGDTFCQECFTPNIKAVLYWLQVQPAETFEEMVVQMDESQMERFGHQDEARPEITEEALGLTCQICKREGVSV